MLLWQTHPSSLHYFPHPRAALFYLTDSHLFPTSFRHISFVHIENDIPFQWLPCSLRYHHSTSVRHPVTTTHHAPITTFTRFSSHRVLLREPRMSEHYLCLLLRWQATMDSTAKPPTESGQCAVCWDHLRSRKNGTLHKHGHDGAKGSCSPGYYKSPAANSQQPNSTLWMRLFQ